MVVLNGDLLTGEDTFEANSTKYIHELVKPFEERNIPWASTYGNHDSSITLDREAILKAEQEHELCLTKDEVPSLPGVSNYHVVIRDANGKSALILYFLDSQGGHYLHGKKPKGEYSSRPSKNHTIPVTNTTSDPKDSEIPGVVSNSTVNWLLKTHNDLNQTHGRFLPSLLFVHIPPTLFSDVQTDGTFTSGHFPGVNDDNPLSTQGTNGHGFNDDKLVKAIMEMEGLHTVFSGHDHGASWCGMVPGRKPARRKFLCFGRHTGQGGYGDWSRGGRSVYITVPEYGSGIEVETWVRLVDGKVISRVGLNETYGRDDYPDENVS